MNGLQLGWLINPCTKTVYVYEPSKEVRKEIGQNLFGRWPNSRFVLDLVEVWSNYEI